MRSISHVIEMGKVQFPAFLAERVYMREFRLETGLPSDLKRWQPTIDQMLAGVDTDGPIYLMVDQGHVRANTSHRRPGAHVDGYWIAGHQRHGGGHSMSAHGGSGHGSQPRPSHQGSPKHGASASGSWVDCDFSMPEATILASDVSASRAFVGEFYGAPGEGGDCSLLDLSQLAEVRLQAGVAYAGNVTMIHESLPVACDTVRTLVRLTVPGWEPRP